jgi:hypothetical protein
VVGIELERSLGDLKIKRVSLTQNQTAADTKPNKQYVHDQNARYRFIISKRNLYLRFDQQNPNWKLKPKFSVCLF